MRRVEGDMRYIAFIALSFFAATGFAVENPLSIELVSEVTSIQPGKPFYVGLHLEHPRGYHTYWKYTGIVGIPTAMEWKLPKGWKADPIEWPEPERVFMFQIKAQGFHGEKLLPMCITPPKNLLPGKIVKLEGKARWMCCGRDCNPGFKELSIELPVSDREAPHDGRRAKMFEESRASVAKQSSDWNVEVTHKNGEVVMRIKPVTPAAKAHFSSVKSVTFFTEDGLIDPNKPELLTKGEGEFVLTQTISEYFRKPLPKQVVGILQTPEGWLTEGKPKSIRIAVSLQH